MKIGTLTLLAAAVMLIGGCGDKAAPAAAPHGSGAPATRTEPTPSPGVSRPPGSTPFSLYVHCGIEWLPLDGKEYRTKRLANEWDNGPPAGWENPEQPGWLTRTGPTTVRFTASSGTAAGKVLDFTLVTAPSPGPPLCA